MRDHKLKHCRDPKCQHVVCELCGWQADRKTGPIMQLYVHRKWHHPDRAIAPTIVEMEVCKS